MVNSNIDLIVKLEEKIDRLVGRYKAEQEENGMLRGQLASLTRQLEDAAASFVQLEERFNNLKISRSLQSSSEDVHETKVRINQIVREIDKCIAMLNR